MKITKILITLITLVLVITPLMAKSKVYMGVYLSELSRKDYEKYGLKDSYGVLIKKIIEDSPAEKAGLKNKDIILEIAGDKVYTIGQLTKMLSLFEPEQIVKIKYFRKKKIKTLNLTLGEKKKPEFKKKAFLGVYLNELDEDDRTDLGLEDEYGILITQIIEGEAAEKAGMQDKDVLLEIEGDKIYTIDQLTKMLSNFEPGQNVKVKVFSDKQYKDFDVTLGEKEDFTSFKFGDFGIDFFKDPGNVFFYQYKMDYDKWIGVLLNMIDEKIVIEKVIERTPAEKAGLEAEDIILALDGKEVESIKEIGKIINKKEAGDKVKLKIERDGKIMTIKSGIAKREDFEGHEKVQISIDDGDIKIFIDGKLQSLEELKKMSKDLQKLDLLKTIEIENSKKFKEEFEKAKQELKKVKEELKDINIDLEISNESKGSI
ncbi:MAG: PDZ domain-containing protein [Candidatus Cloacimonetes bacterium]|nr:PDZ domain-containing protein [Candidatus Cloacimonadota bacterium]